MTFSNVSLKKGWNALYYSMSRTSKDDGGRTYTVTYTTAAKTGMMWVIAPPPGEGGGDD
jgi:hypothetical protein